MSAKNVRELNRRLKIFTSVTIALFSILFFRLWYLQVIQGEVFAGKSVANSVRMIPIPAPRGTLYDRNHVPMVTSRLSFTVSVMPKELGKDEDRVLKWLAGTLDMDVAQIRKEIKESSTMPYHPVRLKRDVDAKTVTLIEERRAELPGVMVEETPMRNYVYGAFGAHLFGYLGRISENEWEDLKEQRYAPSDIVGKMGIERLYEKELRGKDGGEQVEVNRVNRPIRTLGTIEPISGNDLILTIDQKVQAAAEQALDEQLTYIRKNTAYKNAWAGAVVAMNPKTGEILAMVSRPNYDPNLFVGGVDSKYWSELQSNSYRPFTNRVVQAAVPPGSLFKVVTAIGALSDGLTTPQETFLDTGRDSVYPEKKCWIYSRDGKGHGIETVATGLRDSCNIVFYELGRRLTISRLAEWGRKVGIGSPTGFDFSPAESAGLMPDESWKRKAYKAPWYPIEALDVAIGQGALQVTPLQLVTLYSTIANGGTQYQPQIVRSIVAPDGTVKQSFQPKIKTRLDIRPDVLQVVRDGLQMVASKGGTGYGSFATFPIQVAGKTGTAQLGRGIKDTHAWFAGYAPADDPQIVVVILIERGGGGAAVAAPVARKVFDAFFGVEPVQPVSAGNSSGTPVAGGAVPQPGFSSGQQAVQPGQPAASPAPAVPVSPSGQPAVPPAAENVPPSQNP